MKICSKCKVEKELSSFGADKTRVDGKYPYCTDCRKIVKQKWYFDNCDKVRGNVREYRKKNIDKIKKYREEHGTAMCRRQRAKNPKAYVAQYMVANSLSSGELVRPDKCSLCGEEGSALDAHHDNYDHHLLVRWMCRPCHSKHHVEARR